jgi:hypothetical protein
VPRNEPPPRAGSSIASQTHLHIKDRDAASCGERVSGCVAQGLRTQGARDRLVGGQEAREVPGGQQEAVEIGGRDDGR